MNKEEKSINKMRERALEEFTRSTRMIDEYGLIIQPAVDAVPDDIVNNFYLDYTDFNLTVVGGPKDIAAVFRAMRTHGFEAPESRPKINEPNWSGRFKHESGASVWVNFTSSVCKRVKIGTQTVVQDVYEVRCDEIPMDEAVAAS